MTLGEKMDRRFEDGLKEGENTGANRMAQLTALLLKAQRTDELLRATEDIAYRKELFAAYGL